ncbi:MAG: magnesium transporter [SAR202 cluster bacterium]|nr:magnesium transporter [SAR202 cluster bacterium]
MDQNGAQSLLEQRRYDALRHELSTMHAAEVVGLIEDMPEEHVLAAFRLLPKDQAVEVFEQLDPEQQRRILEAFTTDKAQELLQAMSPDDRAALLDEVPAMVRQAPPPAPLPAAARLHSRPPGLRGGERRPHHDAGLHRPAPGHDRCAVPGAHPQAGAPPRDHIRRLRHRRPAPPPGHRLAQGPGDRAS